MSFKHESVLFHFTLIEVVRETRTMEIALVSRISYVK